MGEDRFARDAGRQHRGKWRQQQHTPAAIRKPDQQAEAGKHAGQSDTERKKCRGAGFISGSR
jgi:hypothetical protein